MSIDDWMKKSGATPGKLALVAVLAVVLVVVLVVQYQNLSTPAEQVARPRAADAAPAPATQAARAAQQTKEDELPTTYDAPAWPEMSLDEVLARDPFAIPAWLRPPPSTLAQQREPADDQQERERQQQQQQAEEERAAALAKLREQGTRIVVLTDGEKVAWIGDQSVRIGDSIQGFRITDITAAGVVLTAEKSP